MRVWNLVSAYMMKNCPISKFAKKIRTSQEPAYRCVIRLDVRFGKLGASFEGPWQKATLITPNETKFKLKINIYSRWSHV